MSLTLNNIVLGGFTNGDNYYSLNDLTWSLQYSVCGQTGAQAGICTSLYTGSMANSANALLGGPGKALGVAPSEDFNAISVDGITGPILTIAIDTLGSYALSDSLLPGTADLYTNGDPASGLNPDALARGTYVTVRDSNFFIVGSVAVNYNIVTQTQQFKTLRFRLTNGGNKLIVSELSQNSYTDLATFDVNLNPTTSEAYKIAVSYASPLLDNSIAPARFDAMRFHVQGATSAPISVALTEPLQILSLPFENVVSLAVPPSAAATIPSLTSTAIDFATLSLTAIAASASYLALTTDLSAFVTNDTDSKRVITYNNNI